MARHISLGLSCQSRMTIDAAIGKQSRGPFDYCITEKHALIEALRSDGRSLQHREETASIYTMSVQKREGIHARGVYFLA